MKRRNFLKYVAQAASVLPILTALQKQEPGRITPEIDKDLAEYLRLHSDVVERWRGDKPFSRMLRDMRVLKMKSSDARAVLERSTT